MDSRLKIPFVMQICGPSQSGKSSFVGRLIKDYKHILEKPIDSVIWFSPHGNLPTNLTKPPIPIEIHKTMPYSWGTNRIKKKQVEEEDEGDDEKEKQEFILPDGNKDGKHRLVVLDDFGDEAKNSDAITALYTRGSHHLGISVIQILQNVFWRGPAARTRSLNVHYMVLMRQTRDLQQIRTLAGQLTHNSTGKRGFLKAYTDATQNGGPYSYLLLSFHPRDSSQLMLRTNIFSDDSPWGVVYKLPGTI